MYSKIKKVLTSLILAASLAFAPMNVSSAPTTTITQSTGPNGFATAVLIRGGGNLPATNQPISTYEIEVPESISINFSAENFANQRLTVVSTFSFSPDDRVVAISAENGENILVSTSDLEGVSNGEFLQF